MKLHSFFVVHPKGNILSNFKIYQYLLKAKVINNYCQNMKLRLVSSRLLDTILAVD